MNLVHRVIQSVDFFQKDDFLKAHLGKFTLNPSWNDFHLLSLDNGLSDCRLLRDSGLKLKDKVFSIHQMIRDLSERVVESVDFLKQNDDSQSGLGVFLLEVAKIVSWLGLND